MSKSYLIHNPRCSKCIGAKEILEDAGVEFEVINYLQNGLKEKMLRELPKLINIKFEEMIRTKEPEYKQLNLEGKNLTDDEWIEILMKHPVLLERPIFIHNNKAIIARPAELVKEIL